MKRVAMLVTALWVGAGAFDCAGAQVLGNGFDSLIAQGGVGPVQLSMSERELVGVVGESLVERVDAYVGEGFCASASLVFPDSASELEILWSDTTYSKIVRVRLSARGSPWRTPQGVGVGSTLKELERVAGGPIEFSGFGWEYEGGTTWIEEGLQARLWLVLTEESQDQATTDPQYGDILGDRIVRSDHPLIRQLSVLVDQIGLSGPGTLQGEFRCG